MNQTVLIADSGSTKTDWAMAGIRLQTQGINPFHQDEAAIRAILKNELYSHLTSQSVWQGCLLEQESPALTSIHFYGSGVRPELEEKMCRLLHEVFPHVGRVEAHSDMLGAARALCGHSEGIACILGTGANSCLFDGEHIVKNTPPMGYILGDEGSGAVLGARFLNALYKGRLPQSLVQTFETSQQLTMAQVIDRVYRQPLANRWLASLSVFIHQHISVPAVEQLVVDNFRDFLKRNVNLYDRHDLPVSAIGSIAFYYKEQFAQAANAEGFAIGRIERSPMESLVAYHSL